MGLLAVRSPTGTSRSESVTVGMTTSVQSCGQDRDTAPTLGSVRVKLSDDANEDDDADSKDGEDVCCQCFANRQRQGGEGVPLLSWVTSCDPE